MYLTYNCKLYDVKRIYFQNVWRNMLDSEDTWSNEYGWSFRMCEECVGIDTNLNLNKAQWVNEPSQYIDF